MKIIAIDTATEDTVVAARDGGTDVFQQRTGADQDGRPRHSEVLLSLIGEAAAALGGWGRVERIAVGLGPGTFTGIRIGIATATGLSLSTGVPLAGVSTLAALARGVADQMPGDGPVIPVLDARRGEVFTGLHGPDGRELEPAAVISPDELVVRLRELSARFPELRIGGPGSVRFMDQLERSGFPVPDPVSEIHRLSGRALCDLGAGVPPSRLGSPLEPNYLRAPDAQLWLERDHHHPPAAG